jgi:hypothetical protein
MKVILYPGKQYLTEAPPAATTFDAALMIAALTWQGSGLLLGY